MMVSKIWMTFVVILVCFACSSSGATKSCNPVEGWAGCACQMSDTNAILGLDALVSNDTSKRSPRFTVSGKTHWQYAFHPCHNFAMFTNIKKLMPGDKVCKETTAARFTDKAAHVCDSLGVTSSGKFGYVTNPPVLPSFTGVSITYRNAKSTGDQGAVVYLICNKVFSLDQSTFKYINVTEGVEETYYFSLESPCSCPGHCPVSPKSGSSFLIPQKGTVYMLAIAAVLFFVVKM